MTAPDPVPPEPSRIDLDCDDLVVRLDVTIPGDYAAIDSVVERVLRLADEMRCAEGKEFEVQTALREALANAIRHGAGDDPGRQVQCAVACDRARGMLIVVRDPGPGFDPSAVPDPLVGENIFSHHGRGIYLINQLMDEVRFTRGGTEIHMRKR